MKRSACLRFKNAELGTVLAVCRREKLDRTDNNYILYVDVVPDISEREIRELFVDDPCPNREKDCLASAYLQHGKGFCMEAERGLYLSEFEVAKTHQRKGLGPQVMSAAVDFIDNDEVFAPEVMYAHISLNELVEKRRKFFAREGFEEVGLEDMKKQGLLRGRSVFLPLVTKKLSKFRGVTRFDKCLEGVLDNKQVIYGFGGDPFAVVTV